MLQPNPPRDYADLREAVSLTWWMAARVLAARLRPRRFVNALGERQLATTALRPGEARRFMAYQQARVENRWLRRLSRLRLALAAPWDAACFALAFLVVLCLPSTWRAVSAAMRERPGQMECLHK